MNLLLINLILIIIMYKSIELYYIKYDKDKYKCSRHTHIFGLLFPIINILFINLIYYKKW